MSCGFALSSSLLAKVERTRNAVAVFLFGFLREGGANSKFARRRALFGIDLDRDLDLFDACLSRRPKPASHKKNLLLILIGQSGDAKNKQELVVFSPIPRLF